MPTLALTDEQLEELRGIVAAWISEGFTSPPYTAEQYDIFEMLNLANKDVHGYDIQRPS